MVMEVSGQRPPERHKLVAKRTKLLIVEVYRQVTIICCALCIYVHDHSEHGESVGTYVWVHTLALVALQHVSVRSIMVVLGVAEAEAEDGVNSDHSYWSSGELIHNVPSSRRPPLLRPFYSTNTSANIE
jgi:hypothetical protein